MSGNPDRIINSWILTAASYSTRPLGKIDFEMFCTEIVRWLGSTAEAMSWERQMGATWEWRYGDKTAPEWLRQNMISAIKAIESGRPIASFFSILSGLSSSIDCVLPSPCKTDEPRGTARDAVHKSCKHFRFYSFCLFLSCETQTEG